MGISIEEARTLKARLEKLIKGEKQTPELIASAIEDKLEGTSQASQTIHSRTIRRYHEDMTAEQIAELRSTVPARLLKYIRVIERDLDINTNILDEARKFFSTGNDSYKYRDVARLVGTYDMFRPYWLEPSSPDFMRSRVRIMKRGGHYVFSEYQNWREKGLIEITAGYLFPSSNSIIALCKSRSGKHIKFLSIAPSRYDHENFQSLDRFSGSLIASSDVPPHPGHGFCCVRNSNSQRVSERILKEEMQKKFEIYFSIMLNQVHREMDIDEFLRIKAKDTE